MSKRNKAAKALFIRKRNFSRLVPLSLALFPNSRDNFLTSCQVLATSLMICCSSSFPNSRIIWFWGKLKRGVGKISKILLFWWPWENKTKWKKTSTVTLSYEKLFYFTQNKRAWYDDDSEAVHKYPSIILFLHLIFLPSLLQCSIYSLYQTCLIIFFMTLSTAKLTLFN